MSLLVPRVAGSWGGMRDVWKIFAENGKRNPHLASIIPANEI